MSWVFRLLNMCLAPWDRRRPGAVTAVVVAIVVVAGAAVVAAVVAGGPEEGTRVPRLYRLKGAPQAEALKAGHWHCRTHALCPRPDLAAPAEAGCVLDAPAGGRCLEAAFLALIERCYRAVDVVVVRGVVGGAGAAACGATDAVHGLKLPAEAQAREAVHRCDRADSLAARPNLASAGMVGAVLYAFAESMGDAELLACGKRRHLCMNLKVTLRIVV